MCALSAVAFAVFFTLDHVSPSCFTVLSCLTTFVATRRCRCLLQSVRVNVMPGRLLFVISGILPGGIPGFCIELCWFLHPLIWPLVCLPCFSVLLLVWGHFRHDTQDVIMHESLSLVAIPLPGVVLVGLFLVGLLLFLGFVLCFWFSCCDCILDCVQVHYQYFCGYRHLTALHVNLNSSFATIERV